MVAWGPDRESARRRLLRALHETEVEGIPTTIPAHLAVLSHPDFIEVRHSTTWLSNNVDLTNLAPARPSAGAQPGTERKDLEVEVDGRRFDVSVWVPSQGSQGGQGIQGGAASARPAPAACNARPTPRRPAPPPEGR